MRIRYLSYEILININREITSAYGLAHGILNEKALESILETVKYKGRPLKSKKENLAEKAAYLLYELIAQHPFIDGNKRTALIATITFLELNGYQLEFEEKEVEELTTAIGRGKTSYPEVRQWIINHLRTK